MYTLELTYETGSSFGRNTEVNSLGHCWERLDLAKKAMKSIIEHKKLYEELDSYSFCTKRTADEVFDEVKTKDWFVNATEYKHKRDWKYIIAFEMDDGAWRNCSPFWLGYFETLHKINIVMEGMSHEF